MNTISKFQLIFLGFLVLIIGVAVFIFARAKNSITTLAPITIWGTVSQDTFQKFLTTLALENQGITVTYVQKDAGNFDNEFVNALASGKGPDVVLLPQDLLLRHQDKIYPIPYSSLSERNFKNAYIQEAELYLTPTGILSLPFSVDPLVLYWNRDTFSNAAISTPPAYWDEFYDLSSKLTVKDASLTILKSAVALGNFSNINNAKQIVATLMFQAGNPITSEDASGNIQAVLNQSLNYPTPPAQSALDFYTQFANPVKSFYSWNSSLPSSKNMFLSGDLATYVGFASEYSDLRAKNPNLNFDVTALPQARNGTTKITYGNMLGFAILKVSPHVSDAFSTVYALTNTLALQNWQALSGLPPVRRDLLSNVPKNNSVSPVFYNSALWARAWLDPDPDQTTPIFKNMVDTITSGQARVSEAVEKAQSGLDQLLAK